ncbi:MAG TPA: type II toxin-antitoxin system RelE/ParE family toxin [Mycobacterium sp.]|nr:type II toxin-antitoxin system RelE/ParE family toxin [Mycobacterium sp.]HUH71401.1 type II toxin-antitoxin system RelE/ParE family toxin [Mycobacterium sp.]
MGDRWHVILSAEVTRWYEALPIRELAQADQALDRLAAEGIELAVPHNRYLSDKLWELRFRCGQVNQRITYTADPDRKIVTLTTFRKQRDNERAEIRRARNALRKHQQKKGRPP